MSTSFFFSQKVAMFISVLSEDLKEKVGVNDSLAESYKLLKVYKAEMLRWL